MRFSEVAGIDDHHPTQFIQTNRLRCLFGGVRFVVLLLVMARVQSPKDRIYPA